MAVVSFKSADHLKENQALLHDCLKDWCESVSLRGQNGYIEQERGVWLSCYGVPLNLWNNDSFMKLGRLWGVVLQIDDETSNQTSFRCGRIRIVTNFMGLINTVVLVKCRDRSYPVRICEEKIVITRVVNEVCMCTMHECLSSNMHENQGEEVGDSLKEDDDDVDAAIHIDVASGDSVATIQRTELVNGGSNKVDGMKNVSDPSLVVETMSRDMGNTNRNGVSAVNVVAGSPSNNQKRDGRNLGEEVGVFTSGYMKSLSGLMTAGPGINIQVVLEEAQSGKVIDKPNSDTEVVGQAHNGTKISQT